MILSHLVVVIILSTSFLNIILKLNSLYLSLGSAGHKVTRG